jgi:transposase-like protein
MDIQHTAAPVAGKDYPRNWSEFLDWFASEEACLGYLEKLRWPGGFVCPACGVADEPYRSSRSRLMCRSCSHQGSVTAGTIFDKTRTPLRVWLAAAWYVTNQKLGVSALGLKRVLGLGSYETAWTMLHRFRRAMVRPERELLKGEVEVDETYLAISDRDKPLSSEGRKSKTNKILVAIAVEILQPKGFGRIRLRRIDNDSDACVVPFVLENIQPGARLRTDGSAAYRSLSKIGFEHMGRRNGAVDEHQVAAIDAELVHGIPGDAHQEGGLRMRHKDVVEIQPRDAGVPSGRTEADGHAGAGGAGTGARVPADAHQAGVG